MITSPLTEALGWTLLHSLWQATLVAAVFYCVRRITRHQPPLVYAGALSALLLTVGWSLLTFINLYNTDVSTTPVVTAFTSAPPPPTARWVTDESAPGAVPIEVSWLEAGVVLVDPYVNFVAMGWLVGMLILAARLAGGFWYLDRLKNHHACPLPGWDTKISDLANRLHLRRPVAVLASSRARVPMVIGHLKPVILLPVALLSSLSPPQVEAIIAHELAHVRRWDYAINVLQSLVELIFFYHPAVRWLSSVAREEREKCCDDLAVSLGVSTVDYAKALAEAESLQHAAPPLVMAFAWQRGSLLTRIERLIQPRTPSTGHTAKAVALIPMLLIITYLTGGDTFARKIAGSEPRLDSNETIMNPDRLPSRTEVSAEKPPQEAQENSKRPDPVQAVVPDVPIKPDTIPSEDSEPAHFSFQFGDSSTFSFGMNFSFDSDDSIHQNGFRHWRFSSTDTFPDFAWNDSLWLESVEELSETMGAFSEELATYLEDSVDTQELQQRLGSVQHELSRLQAQLGTSLQRTFSDEKMEALQKKLQREQEHLGRELQEKGRRLQERQRQFQKEAQRQNEVHRRRMEELQQELEEDWSNEENARRVEEVQRALEEMQRQSDDESEWRNEENNRKLRELQQALEMPPRFEGRKHQLSTSEEDSLKFKESQRDFREKQRRFSEENEQKLKKYRVESNGRAQFHNNFDSTVDRLEKELLADGLIKSGKEYRFELKPKGLYINRKEQTEELLNKYRDLLEVSENTNFSITRTAR